jgi:hypothetical protein
MGCVPCARAIDHARKASVTAAADNTPAMVTKATLAMGFISLGVMRLGDGATVRAD